MVDHFFTLSSSEIGTTTPGQYGNHGYRSEGVAGYCYRNPINGTVPLYRYWNSRVGDHFYTKSSNEIGTINPGQYGRYGYKSEGIACFVFP